MNETIRGQKISIKSNKEWIVPCCEGMNRNGEK